jgi:hypothetical protein
MKKVFHVIVAVAVLLAAAAAMPHPTYACDAAAPGEAAC